MPDKLTSEERSKLNKLYYQRNREVILKKRYAQRVIERASRPPKPFPNCVVCGKQLNNYRYKYCPPTDDEVSSKCKLKTEAINKKKRYGGYTEPTIFKTIPTRPVKCLRCDMEFHGHAGNRICPKCTEFNDKTPTREPWKGIQHNKEIWKQMSNSIDD